MKGEKGVSREVVAYLSGRIEVRREQFEASVHSELERVAAELHTDAAELTRRVHDCVQGPWAWLSRSVSNVRHEATITPLLELSEVAVAGRPHRRKTSGAAKRKVSIEHRSAVSDARRKWWAQFSPEERSTINRRIMSGKKVPPRFLKKGKEQRNATS